MDTSSFGAFCSTFCPRASRKVRHYGFLSPNSRISLDLVRWLIALFQGWVFTLRGHLSQPAPTQPRIRCALCGGPMRVCFLVPEIAPIVFDTS